MNNEDKLQKWARHGLYPIAIIIKLIMNTKTGKMCRHRYK